MGSEQQPTTLGALLKQRRNAAGLSMYLLAQHSGLNRSTLMRIEDGTLTQPSTETLNKLALALELEPEELYDAVWQDSSEPLPSPAVYFRSKYQLSDEQIQQLKSSIDRIAMTDDEAEAEAVDDS